jgi:hypothetical protein
MLMTGNCRRPACEVVLDTQMLDAEMPGHLPAAHPWAPRRLPVPGGPTTLQVVTGRLALKTPWLESRAEMDA